MNSIKDICPLCGGHKKQGTTTFTVDMGNTLVVVRGASDFLKDLTVQISLGAEILEGRGSRVRVALNDTRAIFHRPHPDRVTNKGAVKSVRRFLKEAGVNL